MCATTSPAHVGQINCSATGLAKSNTPVPVGGVWYVVTVWRTLEGHHAPLAMNAATYTAALIEAREADQQEAHENACEAYHAIEALQRCDTWLELPLAVRRQLSAAHATLGLLVDGLA